MDLTTLGETALAFFALWVIVLPLERLFPARRQPILRREWWTDLAFYAGQSLLWSGITLSFLVLAAGALDRVVPASFRATVGAQPWLLQALEVILLGDLLVYWGHRLSHRWNFLWRFHAIHHTAERLDWLAAYREHPVDGIYTRLLTNLPALAFGFPLYTVVGLIVLRGMWGVFIHSNVRLPLGPLKYLLGAPELHHWHHDRERNVGCNFANTMPLMDLIFGTYYDPGREPTAYGTKEPVPRGYIGQLLYPLRAMWPVRTFWPPGPGDSPSLPPPPAA